jgi:hypothetical protein
MRQVSVEKFIGQTLYPIFFPNQSFCQLLEKLCFFEKKNIAKLQMDQELFNSTLDILRSSSIYQVSEQSLQQCQDSEWVKTNIDNIDSDDVNTLLHIFDFNTKYKQVAKKKLETYIEKYNTE